MRYFIYYLPAKSLRRIDVGDETRVEEVIRKIEVDFHLQIKLGDQADKTLVLNYNGSDLKHSWRLTDLMIPPGGIVHCFYREKKAAQIYVDCKFNKQILELFDDTITVETTIGELRQKISDKIGLPISTFCLESYGNRRRLYDPMKLADYDIKLHDHVQLIVWRGYEKFLKSCLKGNREPYSNDDLTRFYELQIALYVAAFHGFFELAHSALQLGARSDCPVGEHPSRQWSSETTVQDNLGMLKCPIHIAVERGHMKIVDLFVRNSPLCTQVAHPITGRLPYRMAVSFCASAKTKVDQQRYKDIFFYLHDKQFNLKISSNGQSMDTEKDISHRSSIHSPYFSLPRYCQIMRWYERAQERVWKKYGIKHDYSIHLKRAYQRRGLLGYRVLIDGFNNTFDATSRKSQRHHYGGVTFQKSRVPPRLMQHGLMGSKMQAINFTSINPPGDDLQQSLSSRDLHTRERRKKLPSKSPSTIDDLSGMSDTTSTLPPLYQPQKRNFAEIQSRFDLEIQQLTLKPYERYGSASMHTTAIDCLREANNFTRKSWLKQVEISKEMVKQCTKRRIRRAGEGVISMDTSASRSTRLPECQAN